VKLPYQITGALIAIFGAFMTRESLMLKFYTSQGPGPGLLPLFTSILIAALGVVMFLQASFRATDPLPDDFIPNRTGAFQAGAVLAAAVAFQFFMVPLGFIASSAGFLLFVLLVVGRVKPLLALAVTLAGSVGIYWVFARWLQIPLPKGVFSI
jgi:hypothetical protein